MNTTIYLSFQRQIFILAFTFRSSLMLVKSLHRHNKAWKRAQSKTGQGKYCKQNYVKS